MTRIGWRLCVQLYMMPTVSFKREIYHVKHVDVPSNVPNPFAKSAGGGGMSRKASSFWLIPNFRCLWNRASALGWAVAGATRLTSRSR